MVAVFPLDISGPPLVESSETLLLMSDRFFWHRLCPAEEAFILGSLPWNIMPKYLPLFISTDLHHMFIHPQTYEMSSDWAPDPIHSTGPNIPTIAPWNSPILLLGQKEWFRHHHNHYALIIHHSWLYRCLFNCPRPALDTSAYKTRLH